MKTIEERLDAIEARNARVEGNKAWETSAARKITIIITTYITVVILLICIGNKNPFLNALVPSMGFYLSTLTVPVVKSWWLNRHQ